MRNRHGCSGGRRKGRRREGSPHERDVAAHYVRDVELASGTVYLAATFEAYELLRRWAWRCGRFPELLDQRALQIEAEAMPGLRLTRLPQSLCFIDGIAEGDASIMHLQASRTMKGGSVCGV